MSDGFRARADASGADRAAGGFHVNATIDDGPRALRLVTQAVARAKQGDREAVRFLYLQYADNIYGYVRSIVRDEYEAEDVTQHVFAKLITIIAKYEERDVSFSAWILRVARNVAVDHMRQRRAIPCEEVRELFHEEEDASHTRSWMLRDALATLPDAQREVIVLRHIVGLSPAEISGRLGRTEPSVHGLHNRGRGALCTALSEMQCAPIVGTTAASKPYRPNPDHAAPPKATAS
jgi:RNA polymerase sigma-70 factor (ECF subfamily)